MEPRAYGLLAVVAPGVEPPPELNVLGLAAIVAFAIDHEAVPRPRARLRRMPPSRGG